LSLLTYDLMGLIGLIILGLVILLVIRLIIVLIPAAIVAVVVYFLTDSTWWAGLAFLIIAALSILKKL
jgi:membrane protein YdbS with pleckstrin-like domain